VIVTNESYKRLAIRRGQLPESVVAIVRNGPDVVTAKNGKIDPEVRGKASNILTFAGIMEVQDGVEGLVRTLHFLRHKLGRNDFFCIVMGSGHCLEGVKVLARDLGLENNMHFTGWISDRELYWSYLATSDICLCPEPFNEYNDQSTFVKVMEYMAAGKPIVAFDLKETRFSAQQSALYAERASELEFARMITKLMDDSGLRSAMGAGGQTLVREKLAWQYSEPSLLKVYERLATRYRACQSEPAHVVETKENEGLVPLNVLPRATVSEKTRQIKSVTRE
jgi:glycosyltransferase involved in cell wall biosynthesis